MCLAVSMQMLVYPAYGFTTYYISYFLGQGAVSLASQLHFYLYFLSESWSRMLSHTVG